MDLFINPTLDFKPLEKRAAEVTLPEDPNMWPQEVLQELYKQVPYISDFEPHVQMDTVDGERGYGFGHVRASNQTQLQTGSSSDEQLSAGVREARIPIVIREGKLLPFDLLVTDSSKVQPLTESRLRQSIFRPQVFDVASKTPGDDSLVSQLYPPFQDNIREGGGMTFNKGASVLQSILPTINQADHQRFLEEMVDSHLQAALVKNSEAAISSFQRVYDCTPMGLDKTAEVITSALRPSVLQIRKQLDGFSIKTASHRMWNPQERQVTRKHIIDSFGAKIAMEVDRAGSVTMAEGAEAQGDEDMSKMGPIEEFGLYKVQTTEGDELLGYVIPNLLDVDGTPLPLSLFTNGSQAALQGSISGVPAAEGTTLPTADSPSGYGSFFSDVNGEVQATIPLELQGSFSEVGEGEPDSHMGTTFDGRPVQVSIHPNIQMIVGTEDGKMLVPQHFKWLPLSKAGATALTSPEDEQEVQDEKKQPKPEVSLRSKEEVDEKTAARRHFSSVLVRSGGPNYFSIDGPAVEKLAYEQKEGIDLDGAMFLMAGLGVEQGYSTTKLAHAINATYPVRVRIGRTLSTEDEMVAYGVKTARAKLAQMPVLKVSLLKEAAVIPDPGAVDTVLSLGFINPENLMTFVSYLPSLEDSQGRLCELLLGARLGMEDVSSTALERAVRSLEETIEGLKSLAFSGPN